MNSAASGPLPADRAWEPFEPSSVEPWNRKRVAHLHRRAGFFASWNELNRDLNDGVDAAVNRLVEPVEESADAREVMSGLRRGVADAVDRRQRLPAYWFHRMLFHPDRLREKMTLFWHSHFATSNDKVRSEQVMLQQNELLRKHALEAFPDLLEGILIDPAMLIWLDGTNSPKEKPNENLAREFLELFTLGVGNYSEQDIRAAARAFTGWLQSPGSYGTAEFRFDEGKFDDGMKQFLGASGPWRRADIVKLTLDSPACARFLCRKLYRHFVDEFREPSPELIEPLATELRSSGYSIRHVLRIILRSNQFFANAVNRQRIASPVELSVGLLRALDFPRNEIRLIPLIDACHSQGQQLFYPPNVAGWPGSKHWITTTNVVERTNWLSDVIWGRAEFDQPSFNPVAWLERSGVSARDAVDVLIDLLLQGDLSKEAREMATTIARPGDPNSLRMALQVVAYCPEFQLM